ncbi:hypothetical protein CHLNCDRAFT_138820 [Chlorella variabilis]|uniref:Peroxisomal membrane protein PMP22 n=1 Tax=Chlorella variabilis TaxID=554065 RepID=E1ZP42_CHLVA|nr:hypothetical protein CHLNCDRAFT_138820 [Chlorella variabilis]EFN52473.1 hypothetical protein CHLNCDRAFT_138820 [Chlorella variabilis]|eukprot:XP_005844575.1 hypothetical protein CHLNCDRAFT_138820 [Chlorella variabilis]
MSGGVLALAWRRYLQALDQKPLKTKAVTAAVLIAASDLLAQRLTSAAPTNWRRTLSMALYGFLWAGPSSHFWQHILENMFPDKSDALRSVKKVLVDQLAYGPVQNALFMAFLASVVEGRSWATTRAKLASDWPGVQRRSWRVWPVASFISQEYVPLKASWLAEEQGQPESWAGAAGAAASFLRVLWLNVVALGWTTFMILQGRTANAAVLRLKLAAR